MIRLVRLLHRLSENADYRRFLFDCLPDIARFAPIYPSVMMGYDFHLAAGGPKLIEVNTNAGGLWYANLSSFPEASGFQGRLGARLIDSFRETFARYRDDPAAVLKNLVILDEKPEEQPLFTEMGVFAELFNAAGIQARIADPGAIEAREEGLYLDGRPIDMIYNRHCDFYLETSALSSVRKAYLEGRVCLSPNPDTYGLLADKRRMLLWCRPEAMSRFGLVKGELDLLADTVPETVTLAALSPETAWQTRKQWVFKPETGYASRGVYVGEKLTHHKLAELDPGNTLLQRRIPPSPTQGGGETFKTDYRLFVYRNRPFFIAARIYQGQVTNLRTEQGGFARVRLTD